MTDPLLALRTGIRLALGTDPGVTAILHPTQITTGWVNPSYPHALILRDGQSVYLGRAAGGYLAAELFLDLHVWAPSSDGGLRLGGAVAHALFDAPEIDGLEVDEWQRPAFRWMTDPDPKNVIAHGITTVQAAVRWQP